MAVDLFQDDHLEQLARARAETATHAQLTDILSYGVFVAGTADNPTART